MDVPVLVYLGVVGMAVIPFHHDVRHWPWVPIRHAFALLLLLEMIRFNSLKRNALLDLVRTFYPVLWIGFSWKELNNLVTMIFPYWANAFVIQMDLSIFGAHPSVWVQHLFRPWLTELMNFLYATYYFFIPLAVFPLYFKGKKKEAFNVMFLLTLTISVCFMLFFFFPAEGAWVVLKDLHTVQPEGGFFLRLVQAAQSKGTIRGGAFPSSHVAAAFILALGALHYNRKIGWVMLSLVFGIALSTVYCRYHHAVDALSGIAVGFILYGIGLRILKWRGLA